MGVAVREKQNRLKEMVESSQDWFWEFDENANFTYVSPRVRDLLGYEPNEILGLNAFDLMDSEEAARVREHFDPIANKFLPFNNLENVNLHKDGHEVVLESSGTPVFDEKGKFCGYRGIDRDITKRKKIEKELRDSREKLNEALKVSKRAERKLVDIDKMRNDFISAAAHELNTPLSTIMGYVEILLNPEEYGDFPENQKQEFLKEVYSRAEALNRIIEDLLDVSCIKDGHVLALSKEEIDVNVFLSNLKDYFTINHKGHSFTLDLPSQPLKPIILIDRLRIRQVIDNLISNAIKYSPKGTDIILRAQEIVSGWEIKVEDRGIGMSQEQTDRIFDKFYRADTADTSISGLGLGMSIVKEIVEAHKGSIRVMSKEGEGTTVTFFLPGPADC